MTISTIPLLAVILLSATSANCVKSSASYPYLAMKRSPNNSMVIAAGTSNFKELVQKSSVFLDKTLIIEKILKMPEKAILINLPKSWSKSITLDMLKTFLEPSLDEDGNEIIPRKKTENYRLFKNGEIILPNGELELLQSPLYIANRSRLLDTYQGRYPVINLNLGCFNGSSYLQVFHLITTRISELFRRHDYVMKRLLEIKQGENSTEIAKAEADFDLKLFKKTVDGKIDIHELMDNWDGILPYLIIEPHVTETQAHLLIGFLSGLMVNTFKTNVYLKKGIMIGLGIFNGLDLIPSLRRTVKQCKTFSNSFFKLCGVTAEEANALFDQMQLTNEERKRAKAWYNGYSYSAFQIYNPRSLTHFLSEKKIDNYNMRYDHNINFITRRIFENNAIRHELEKILRDKRIYDPLCKGQRKLSYNDLFVFKENFEKSDNAEILIVRTEGIYLYMFLPNAGYFFNPYRYIVRIVNDEMKNEWLNKIMDYYKDKYSILSDLENAFDNLVEFIANDNSTSKLLTDDLQSLVNVLSAEQIHFIIRFLTSQITMKYEYRSRLPEFAKYDKIRATDILCNKKRGIVIITTVTNETAEEALKRAESFKEYLKVNENTEICKYISVNAAPQNIVRIQAKTQKI